MANTKANQVIQVHPKVSDNEEQLVTLACKGDDEAFSQLVHSYWPLINGYLIRLTGDAGLAADLTQEVFLRAYRGLDHFSKDRVLLFRPWIYKIATNLSNTHRQRKKNRSWLSLDWLFSRPAPAPALDIGQVIDSTPGPVDRSLAAENSREVVAVLNQLPKEQVTILLLRFYQELSSEEIAEVLGIAPDAVRARVYRARQAFLREYSRQLKKTEQEK